jgi:hypothetical protein
MWRIFSSIRNSNYQQVIPGVFLLIFSLLFLSSCQESEPDEPIIVYEETIIAPDDPNILYHGRINFSDSLSPKLFWAGSGFTAWFDGTSVEVRLNDDDGISYYNAIIDDDMSKKVVINCFPGDSSYVIATDLDTGVHKLQILRRTDPTNSFTEFKGLKIFGSKQLVEPQLPPDLKIEFYGNSITTGHGILDETRENNDDKATWDNYQTYAAKTARALEADYRCISMSGIGVLKSWYPLTMPQAYNRLDPNDPSSNWDFSSWEANIVVINLFQNDAWLLRGKSSEQIITAYKNFVANIRGKYPDAHIFCALGNMDATRAGQPWPGYVEAAVQRLNEDGDDKVYSIMFPHKNTGGHPTLSEHQQMADILIPFIKEKADL